jgi:hypothetical protein
MQSLIESCDFLAQAQHSRISGTAICMLSAILSLGVVDGRVKKLTLHTPSLKCKTARFNHFSSRDK